MAVKVKHSVTGRITLRLVILLVIVLAVMFTGSYHIVNRIILNREQSYAKTITGMLSDQITYRGGDDKLRYADMDSASMRKVGDYICRWYPIDFAFAYIPHVEDGTITVRFVSEKPDERTPLSDIEDDTSEYLFTEEELAFYGGSCTHLISENKILSTMMEVRYVNTDADGVLMVLGVGISLQRLRDAVWQSYWPFALVTGIILLLMAGAIYFIIRRGLMNPAIRLSNAMSSFIQDGKRGEKLPESNIGDEFSMIAHAYNNMSDDIDTYLSDIRGLTQQQEQQQTALNIAAGIQQSFLQAGSFIAPHCEIHAMMSPAADIGGDLYDYMTLDDDRTFLTIADVSGKGVAASMYMAASLMLMRRLARMGFSPAQILENTNNSLCERNPRMLFITAFVAVYNNKTGTLTYANAGHDLPYVLQGRESVRTLEGGRGTVLGLFPDEAYTDAHEQLRIGDVLLLYTDGVNESNNAQKEFFGNERIEQTLRMFAASHEENPVAYLEAAVRGFVGECEQHDDMTMLSMTVKETRTLLLPVQNTAFEQIRTLILQSELPMALRMDLCLAAEEIFVNICSYAYPAGAAADERIRFDLELSDRVLIRFTDRGVNYDPTQHMITADEYDLTVGGLGRLIAFTVTDQVIYERLDDQNILTMTKFKYDKEEPHDHPSAE